MWLTYFMVDWKDVKQEESDQKCSVCGRPLSKTEAFEYEDTQRYDGYVCHFDKQVTWIRSE